MSIEIMLQSQMMQTVEDLKDIETMIVILHTIGADTI